VPQALLVNKALPVLLALLVNRVLRVILANKAHKD